MSEPKEMKHIYTYFSKKGDPRKVKVLHDVIPYGSDENSVAFKHLQEHGEHWRYLTVYDIDPDEVEGFDYSCLYCESTFDYPLGETDCPMCGSRKIQHHTDKEETDGNS